MLSAFVPTPIFPASLNFASSHSMAFSVERDRKMIRAEIDSQRVPRVG
jgi:hypothetical protein